ncbi:MAG: MerR family transcriptional regulator [Pseudooceanicola sp.]
MAKSADAFRTISEVADWLGTPAHVLRFWESKFTQVKPVKRAGGRRYYRPADMELLGGIKQLLHEEGMTIKASRSSSVNAVSITWRRCHPDPWSSPSRSCPRKKRRRPRPTRPR